MSPLWNDELRIVIAPDRMVLARVRRGLRARLLDKQVLRPATRGAQGALDTLDEVLATPCWQRTAARVMLCGDLARYTTVAWSDQLGSADEEAALVRHRFAEIYGGAADALELRWSGEGAWRLACGIERELLHRLPQLCAAKRIRLKSVRPLLMAVFNRFRHSLPETGCWLAVVDSGAIYLSRIASRSWSRVRSMRCRDWQHDLPSMIRRERLTCSEDDAAMPVYLFAPEMDVSDLQFDGLAVEPLLLPPPAGFGSEGEYSPAWLA